MQNEQEPIKEIIEVSEKDIDEMWAEAKASMSAHSWIQQGTEIICDSCPFKHSFYLEPGQILKGIDEEGMPIIDKIQY